MQKLGVNGRLSILFVQDEHVLKVKLIAFRMWRRALKYVGNNASKIYARSI